MEKNMKQQGKKVLVLVIGVVILLVIIVGVFYNKRAQKTNERQVQAEVIAKNIVSLYLKSPASAQFTSMIVKDKNVIVNILKNINNEEANDFVAFGDVDSENSFGALLRNHFFLEFNYQGVNINDSKNWQVNRLELGNNLLISDKKILDPEIPMSEILILGTLKLENMYKASDELMKLKELRDKESISEGEFQQKTKQLLNL